MKHVFRLIRIAVLLVLLLVVVSAAAYRLDPSVPEGKESTASLSSLFTDAVAGTISDLTGGSSAASSKTASKSAAQSVVDSALGAVVDVETTGSKTDSGQEILSVQVPAATLPALKDAASQKLGGTVTTDQLVGQLNRVSGVSAAANPDGSLSVNVPQDVYENYKAQLAGTLGG